MTPRIVHGATIRALVALVFSLAGAWSLAASVGAADGAGRRGFVAPGDLSAAPLAEMPLEVGAGASLFRSTDTWEKRAFGWLLHASDAPSSPTPRATATPAPTASPAPSRTPTPTP